MLMGCFDAVEVEVVTPVECWSLELGSEPERPPESFLGERDLVRPDEPEVGVHVLVLCFASEARSSLGRLGNARIGDGPPLTCSGTVLGGLTANHRSSIVKDRTTGSKGQNITH